MKKNNIGLLVMIMLLGLSNLSYGVSDAAEPMIFKADENNASEIKVNKEILDLAKAAMDEKNYSAAINYLTSYINSKPKKYEPYKMRGKCYYALHKFDLAENDFKTAIDIKTSDDKFKTGAKVISAVVLGADKQEQYQNTELGNLYGDLMYAQKAQNKPEYEETYKKAFEYNSHIYLPTPKKEDILKINCPQKYGKTLNPTGVDADIASVINNIENGNYHEAGYKISNITSAYPEYYFGHYLAGVVMTGLEHDKDAIKSFEKALKYNPEDFESLASLGQIYYSEAEKTFNKENAQKSIEYFNKALKFFPNNSKYNYYIGLNNLLMGDLDASISSFNSAISQKENDYNSIYYKLLAQQMKGDYNSVIDGTTKLLNKHVSNSNSVQYLRALAYFNQGSYDLALADVDKVFSNMNDLYNSDIKTTSAKEKTLENYLYLLKSQIDEKQGVSNSQDLVKAYENPIIKALNSSENTEITINSSDIENQYDYIRTAFNKPINVFYDGFGYKLSGNKQNNPVDLIKPQKREEIIDLETPSISQILAEKNIVQNSSSTKTVSEPDITTPSIAKTLAMPQSQAIIENSVENTEIIPVIEKAEKIKAQAETEQEKPEQLKSETSKSETETKGTVVQTEKQETIVLETPQPKFVQKAQTVANNDYVIPNSYLTAVTPQKNEVIPEVKITEKTDETKILSMTAKNDLPEEEKSIEDFKISYNDDKKLTPILSAANPKDLNTDVDSIEKTQELKEFIAQAPIKDVTEYSDSFASSVEDKKAIAAGIASGEILDSMDIREEKEPQKIVMPQSSSPESTLAKANESSMAKALALSAITSMSENAKLLADNTEKEIKAVENDIKIKQLDSDIIPNSKIIKDSSILITDNNDNSTVISAPEKKETETFNITYKNPETKLAKVSDKVISSTNEISADTEKAVSGFKTTASEMKESPDFNISYNKLAEVQTAEVKDNTQEILKEVAKANLEKEVADSVKEITKPINNTSELAQNLPDIVNKVNEKYANVDLSEFNVKSQKELLIKPEDEIVVFEPESFIAKAAENVFEKTNSTNSESTIKLPDDISKALENIIENSKQTAENTKKTENEADKVAQVVKEQELELVSPETVKSEIEVQKEKITPLPKEEIPNVVPKLRTQKAVTETVQEEEKELAQRVSEAIKQDTEKQEEWLWDFLHNNEDNAQNAIQDKTTGKLKKIKTKTQKEKKKWFSKKDKLQSDVDKQAKAAAKKAKEAEKQVKNENKKFQWWWKREKAEAEKPVKVKTQKIKNETAKQRKTLKDIFSKKSQSTEIMQKDSSDKKSFKLFKKSETKVKQVKSETKSRKFWFKRKSQ